LGVAASLSRVLAPFRRRTLQLSSLTVLWLLPLAVLAAGNVTILTGTTSAASDELVAQLKTELAEAGNGNQAIRITTARELADVRTEEADLVVTVGVQAFGQAAGAGLSKPVLGVLVPQQAYEQIVAENNRPAGERKFSAIYIDQPFSRQFSLLRQILPNAGNVGVLLGQSSLSQLGQIKQAASRLGIGLIVGTVTEEQTLLPKLRLALEGSYALLAVPDPAIYNRETAQSILLTSYRYQKPVISFSQAYVKAGALAAVYSTPRQIARQAVEIIRQYVAKPTPQLPPPQYPKYFSVSVNTQVAHSLDIKVEDEKVLSDRLGQTERLTP